VTPPPEAQAPEAPRPDAGVPARRGRGLFANEEAFTRAKAAAELRATQFRAAFAEEADLPPEKEQALEALVAKLNGELAAEAEKVAAGLAGKPGELAPRDLVDVGVRLLGVYQRLDDEWKGTLDPRGRAALEKTGFDLLTQIDLDAVRAVGARIEQAGVRGRGP
jgi:hypothetical protein